MKSNKSNKGLLIGGGILAAGAAAYFLLQKTEAVKALNVNVTKLDYNRTTKTLLFLLE